MLASTATLVLNWLKASLISTRQNWTSNWFVAFACLVLQFPGVAHATFLTFNSEPGDFIGGGTHQTWTPLDGTFSISNADSIAQISFNGGPTNWDLSFAAPFGRKLTPGPYEGATRFPFQDPGVPGLDVSGSGRGSNTLTGRFDILEAIYGTSGSLQRFSANFEQHSEGAAPALFGNVVYDVTDAVASPDAIRAATHMSTQQLQNLTPYLSRITNTSTGVFLTGQAGDFIVGDQTLTFLPTSSAISVAGGLDGIHVTVDTPEHFWSLDFVPPATLPLATGDWGGATRYPFQSPTKPGLDVSGDGRGSNELFGDFEVLSASFGPQGEVKSLDVLFEQHSEGGIPASFGRVRFNASVDEPTSISLFGCALLLLSMISLMGRHQ